MDSLGQTLNFAVSETEGQSRPTADEDDDLGRIC